ncbi:hypothetical protein FD755_019819 [Muntiacus reevesi]|uniref:NADH dehydrogenase [ubiquinone] 1 alpha subcomplex subunit 5 n=1 Tax=Muntiacus reevesi TaxID=9886 RepID=A0A5N3X514_MUNRE|nr:hypothetical protein FD755_019819 [Muntiacus reevesi]
MAGLLKTTDLLGLTVCKTPYERSLKNAAYRKYTEQITNEKLSMVKAEVTPVKVEPDVKNLGEQLQGGQIEKVILQWKPWDPLLKEPPANQWKWPV